MIVGYEIEVEGLSEQIALLESYEELSNRELLIAMDKSVRKVEQNVYPFVPIDHGARGGILGAIGSEVEEISSLSIIGRVGVGSYLSNVEYPKVMEFGRKPGSKIPPTKSDSPLTAWVKKKLLQGEKNEAKVRRVTFLVARKIARQGIKPREYLKKGFEKSLGDVKDYFATALENIANGLSNRR